MAANCEESQMQYFPFDFHKECSKLRWDRLSILMEQVAPVQARQRFFLVEHTEKQTNVRRGEEGGGASPCALSQLPPYRCSRGSTGCFAPTASTVWTAPTWCRACWRG